MTRQINRLALALMAAFVVMALAAGYWAVIRQPALLARADNPRRLLLERRYPRGAIYDRNGEVLAESQGTAGDYVRHYPYPRLAPVLGYVSPFYGTAGVEAAADAILHGEAQDDDWKRWWDALAGMPPIGRAVQLTLDLRLQRMADDALGERAGAVVLVDAATGEILALASHPTFDPNTLEANWSVLVADPGAPLLNRATLALYQPGGALYPAILAAALQARVVEPGTVFVQSGEPLQVAGLTLDCRQDPHAPALRPAEALQFGCPKPFAELGERLGATRLEQLFTDLRLLEAPEIGLPTVASDRPDFANRAALALGQGTLTITPLHLALVTAAIAERGELPAPQLLRAIQAGSAWERPRAADHPVAVFAPEAAQQVKALLGDGYTAEAVTGTEGQTLAWFSGFKPYGTTSYAVAVLLEDGDTEAVARIGRGLLRAAASMP